MLGIGVQVYECEVAFFSPVMGVKFDISLGFVFFKTVVTLDLSTPRSPKLILKDQFPLRCDVLEGDFFFIVIYLCLDKESFIHLVCQLPLFTMENRANSLSLLNTVTSGKCHLDHRMKLRRITRGFGCYVLGCTFEGP